MLNRNWRESRRKEKQLRGQRIETTSSKVKQCRSTIATMAKKTESALTVGPTRVYSDGGSGENRCDNGMLLTEGRVTLEESICHRDG